MPRFDAKIEVVCDECGFADFWEPDFTYADYSGKNGHYDTTDRAFLKWCSVDGWTEDSDMTFCPSCSEPEEATE